jgi:hypothetical protein
MNEEITRAKAAVGETEFGRRARERADKTWEPIVGIKALDPNYVQSCRSNHHLLAEREVAREILAQQ